MDAGQRAVKIAAFVSELLNSIAVLFVNESRRPEIVTWREGTQERLRELNALMGASGVAMRSPGFNVERIQREAEELLRLLAEWRAPCWPALTAMADCGKRLLQEFGVTPEQIGLFRDS